MNPVLKDSWRKPASAPRPASALASTRDRGVSSEPAQSTSSKHWIATCWTVNSADVAGCAPGAVAWRRYVPGASTLRSSKVADPPRR